MAANFQILTDDKYVKRQLAWLERQFASFKDDSFKDYHEARSEFDKGMVTIYSPPQVVFSFMDQFLSDIGVKRLNTALKVAKKRDADRKASNQRLQVTLDDEASWRLYALVEKTGLTKNEIIKQLIKNATEDIHSEDFEFKL